MDAFIEGLKLVFDPYVLMIMFISGAYGISIGAIPGLTATMAVALLIPITFSMDAIPAMGAIVTTSAMAIFAGDLPGALLRIPGTPASGAYTDDAYNLTRQGKAELALGVGVVMSAVGGIVGSIVLVLAAPALAEVALNFSTYEYFWLSCLGLTCAAVMSNDAPLKGAVSMILGLATTTIGVDVLTGQPRFTFGSTEMLSGIGIIPALIGIFAVTEILRICSAQRKSPPALQGTVGNIFKDVWGTFRKYWFQFFRGNFIGIGVGALPGAGSDIGAWITYAVCKKFSKTPEKFGKGHVEGIVEATAANNSGLAAEWIPAMVFGIPGSTITAMVIGVLIMKDMQPGPTVFINSPELIYGTFITFFVANFLMIFFGYFAIKGFKHILKIPPEVLMPTILMFCIIGSFSMNNSGFGIVVMLILGLFSYILEENGFPTAPMVLAMVLGEILEQNFLTSMIKSNGNPVEFFSRPIAGTLGVLTILIWLLPLIKWLKERRKPVAELID